MANVYSVLESGLQFHIFMGQQSIKPTTLAIGLTSAVPTNISIVELPNIGGYVRQQVSPGGSNWNYQPHGKIYNNNPIVFPQCTSYLGWTSGVFISDNVSYGSGNYLFYNSISPATEQLLNYQLTIPISGLLISWINQSGSTTPPVSGSYTVNSPSIGDVAIQSNDFLVQLTSTISGSITIIPSSTNNDGTFSPTSLTLNNSVTSGTFTYTPLVWGSRNIVFNNNIGTTPPSSNYISRIRTGPCQSLPSGNLAPNLGSFNIINNNNIWWNEFGRDISGEAVSVNSSKYIDILSSYGASIITSYSETIQNRNSAYQDVYTVESGNIGFLPLATVVYPAVNNPSSFPFYQGITQQSWPWSTDVIGISGLINKSYNVLCQSGSSSLLSHFRAGDKILFSNPGYQGNPVYCSDYYIVSGVINNFQLVLTTAYKDSTKSYGIITGPWNRTLAYEDPGYPFFSNTLSDGHVLAYVRDENNGYADLWEAYNLYTSGVSKDKLICTSSVHYQYTDTTSPPNPAGSTTAAGVPMLPLMLNYDEAVNNRINHCLGTTIQNWQGALRFRCVWPALQAAAGLTYQGIPYGGRLRLRQDWLAAHSGSFSQINRNILGSMAKYGLMITDGGLNLNVWTTNDDRWSKTDLDALNGIPASGFEVVASAETPQYSLTGPASGSHLVSNGPFVFSYLINDNINMPAWDTYLQYSTNGTTFSNAAYYGLSTNRIRNMFWTPPTTGLFYLRIFHFDQFSGGKAVCSPSCWLGPPMLDPSGNNLGVMTFLSY